MASLCLNKTANRSPVEKNGVFHLSPDRYWQKRGAAEKKTWICSPQHGSHKDMGQLPIP